MLMTKEIASKTPALYTYEQTDAENIPVTAHFFGPMFDWFMTEYDPEQKLAFGYVYNRSDSWCSELGYFSMAELEQLERMYFCERDKYFGSHNLAEVMEEYPAF